MTITLKNLTEEFLKQYSEMESNRSLGQLRKSKSYKIQSLLSIKDEASLAQEILKLQNDADLGTKLKAAVELLATCATSYLEPEKAEASLVRLADMVTADFGDGKELKIATGKQFLGSKSYSPENFTDTPFSFTNIFKNKMLRQAQSYIRQVQGQHTANALEAQLKKAREEKSAQEQINLLELQLNNVKNELAQAKTFLPEDHAPVIRKRQVLKKKPISPPSNELRLESARKLSHFKSAMISNLQKQVSALQVNLTKTSTDKEKQRKGLLKSMSKLRQEKVALAKFEAEREDRFMAVFANILSLKDSIDDLNNQLEQSELDNASLNNQLANLIDERNTDAANSDRLFALIAELTDQLNKNREIKRDLEEECEYLKAKLAEATLEQDIRASSDEEEEEELEEIEEVEEEVQEECISDSSDRDSPQPVFYAQAEHKPGRSSTQFINAGRSSKKAIPMTIPEVNDIDIASASGSDSEMDELDKFVMKISDNSARLFNSCRNTARNLAPLATRQLATPLPIQDVESDSDSDEFVSFPSARSR